jgi:hypothetical protein
VLERCVMEDPLKGRTRGILIFIGSFQAEVFSVVLCFSTERARYTEGNHLPPPGPTLGLQLVYSYRRRENGENAVSY